MFFKILKKLKLSGAVRALLLPLANAFGGKPLTLTAEEAEARLAAHSPDPGSSAYTSRGLPEPSPDFDLDIIVPVYNVEHYLPACIDSILSQETGFRFRVIFVNDGSTDNSGKLLDAYRNDPRVLVIHQENKGLSGARNTGIAASSSSYLLFVDSDDRLAPGAVQAMLSAAIQNQAALVQGCFATFHSEEPPRRELSMPEAVVLNPPLETFPGYAWGKLIRRDYFRRLQFPEGYWYEDSVNAQILFPILRRDHATVVGIQDIVYHYRENPQGISFQAQKRPKALDSFWLTRKLQTERQLFSLETTQADYEYLLDMAVLTFERTAAQPRDIQESLLIAWNAFFTEHCPNFRTARRSFEALEAAIQTKNFAVYSLCCKLL